MSRYPDIRVQLVGTDGNAYAILGKMEQALKTNDVEQAQIDEFMQQAMSADYNHLLRTCMDWVNVS